MRPVSACCGVWLALCLILAFVSATSAAAWRGSTAYQACVDAAKSVDSEIAACGQTEFDRQDKILNTVYADRLKKADGKLRQAIKTAQKFWLANRDPTCVAESLVYEGGTFENVAYAECEARTTIERIEWLKGLDQ